ncbi:hypothetical protein LP419_14490 [Massilia sp. H-1]|nr:hypothetical protein LP419_14490 [Massilia sp. H-1]
MQLFAQPGYELEKLLVLQGDKMRATVAYPVDKTDKTRFLRAYYTDMTAYINRGSNGLAQNLGNFAPTIAGQHADRVADRDDGGARQRQQAISDRPVCHPRQDGHPDPHRQWQQHGHHGTEHVARHHLGVQHDGPPDPDFLAACAAA